MINRHSGCPLCGGKLSALELLDACDELADAALGVLAARCPYCQGHLEIRPVAGGIEVGYRSSRVSRSGSSPATCRRASATGA